MTAPWRSRTTAVWALLVGATLLSWGFGHGVGLHGRAAGVAVLAVAFVKLRFVMFDFMELRHAPPWMRLVAQIWMLLCAALLIGLLVAGSRSS